MKNLARLIFLIFAIILLIFIFYPHENMLVISKTQGNKIVGYFQLQENEDFILSFTHSINKRPVYEYIKLQDGQLVVYKARYDAFGAGMPETEIGSLQIDLIDNSVVELTNINRKMDEFSIFVGTVANHAIAIKNKTIPLNTIASPGESLTFQVRKISYFNLWKEMI